ncbi:heme-binding domain-containing protein [Niabella drilacis]|uniref:Haem-binding domain-containing protein n=1 Tax=Niabella drilacis (strain DSM 25811 / CCM 8410 / CCUG 62505 / LMG 26954 / E90) TaxID=1285928 RepID=A0A1G6L961_NIADE|nr:heme-binding domain-containing protein [Niabella drilacis]SDC39325.1 Haem-binding domain-containing protein [Niabella drilacis]
MKPFRTGTGIVLLLIAGLQFVPRPPRNRTTATAGSFANLFAPPPEVQQVLTAACLDCHSNNTRYPWYAMLQPVNAFMNRHIQKGKKKLNFDEVAGYGMRKQRTQFNGIVNALNKGSMPLRSYTLVHGGLTAAEKEMLIRYFTALKDRSGKQNGPNGLYTTDKQVALPGKAEQK